MGQFRDPGRGDLRLLCVVGKGVKQTVKKASGRILKILVMTGVILMMFSCSPKKYRVSFESPGFKTAKTMYAPGDAVEVSYMVATDTSYNFYSDDVDFDQDYDWQRGVILRFTMPEHDVKIGVSSRNSMIAEPYANQPPEEPKPVDSSGEDDSGKKWFCPECGTENTGKYCSECGVARP